MVLGLTFVVLLVVEADKPVGVFVGVGDERGDAFEGGGVDVMFDAFGDAVGGFVVDADLFQEGGDEAVAAAEVFGEGFAVLGGEDAAVAFVVEEAFVVEALHGFGGGGCADGEVLADVGDIGVAFLADMLGPSSS